MNNKNIRSYSRYKNLDRFEEHQAYLYSIHRGKLECFEGVVSLDKEKTLGAVFYLNPSIKVSSYQVDEQEGILRNLLVWFYEKSDEKAREIFIAYERSCIKAFEEKIKAYERMISLLKENANEI